MNPEHAAAPGSVPGADGTTISGAEASVPPAGCPPRAADRLTVGAYDHAARPAPHGAEELGRWFVDAHGGVAAAFGWVLWRLRELEERGR